MRRHRIVNSIQTDVGHAVVVAAVGDDVAVGGDGDADVVSVDLS